jgi:hypothetical protein
MISTAEKECEKFVKTLLLQGAKNDINSDIEGTH